jgi:cytochrome c553
MVDVAKGMSDNDLRGFAELIGTLPASGPPVAVPDALRMARGKALAQQYRCGNCHGRDFAGGQQVPRVAHQREDYLQHALRGFRAGTRLGYTNAMGEALAGLNAENLDDLAHFLAHGPVK